jgi:enoyl-CoA hydratase
LLRHDRHGRIAVLTLDREDKRNALHMALCERLRDAVRTAVADGTRALVLTGAGTSFCAGADLDAAYSPEFREALYEMLHAVADAPIPVIAAVNGPAIGGGTQLAIAADLRVAGPAAVFAVPTVKLGLAVDPWTIRRLAHVAGHSTARSMLMTGAPLDADAAQACGLAQRRGELVDALAWAEELVDLAPLTVGYTKLVLNEMIRPSRAEAELVAGFEACWASDDVEEGRHARAQRRRPRFTGR